MGMEYSGLGFFHTEEAEDIIADLKQAFEKCGL